MMNKRLKIRRAAVLGSGVMGAQIAALLSAAGIRVYLLDLANSEPPKDAKDAKVVGKNFRSARSILAIENLKSLKPSPLFSPSVLTGIIPGNFEDDMSVLRECDWVVEAVIEKLEIKQQLFKQVLEYAKPGIPITTNTSGINLDDIAKNMPEEFVTNFFGTHFFNPPRYMKLLEVIPHGLTRKELISEFSTWAEERLGKGVVHAFDTVNFIANRIGVFVNQATLQSMSKHSLSIETVDALTGKLMGRPSSATFRTMDVVGLDTFAHVAKNTFDRAPKDPFRDWFKMPPWLEELITTGKLGQKTNNVGCYKKDKDSVGKTVILSYRPESKNYVAQVIDKISWLETASRESNLIKRLAFIIDQEGPHAQFVWELLRDTFSYSAILMEDIAGGLPKPVDDAIKWGFNWEMGPFELWQGLGYDKILNRMRSDKANLPDWCKPGLKFYDIDPGSQDWFKSGPSDQFYSLKPNRPKIPAKPYDFRLPKFATEGDSRIVASVKNASLVDIGDGVACLTFHSRMNALDSSIVEFILNTIKLVTQSFDGLVIGNNGEAFSAGANLKEILEVISKKDWQRLEQFIRLFQGALQTIKYAPFPVVAATHGMALGGGCEVALHCDHRVSAGETYAGLVEIGVGLIPAGGGTKELAIRAYDLASQAERADPMPFLQRAFLLIGLAKTSSSAAEAVEMGLFPSTTNISISRDHVVARAKNQTLTMLDCGYVPPTPRTDIKVVGDPGFQTFKMMLYNMSQQRQVSAHDALIAESVARVLCGGEVDGGSVVSEQYLLDLEREAFVELCKTEKTVARIEHMLKTGAPLRN
jgi:3-hydroxyacyl-CoA dehydrogenase